MGECQIRIVQRAWSMFASGDAERILSVFTPDAEWLAPPRNATAEALGISHHMIGAHEIARFLADDFPRLYVSNVTIDFTNMLAAGSTVVVEETMSATLADGSDYVNDYCFIFELDGDRIRRVREYMDTAHGNRQLDNLLDRRLHRG
ncbi:ketosteroid isomerase [Aeromicrobium sp. Root236]|uniref:nuclear transport factor 2 family protein n=1 Tax=Aeromicrobium sp. Root236 TaxID=1736498 RepID=UPI0006F597E7|nr:nuclear transport factor 2 family protein [Aeromicrobium sp. Root236]KRC64195.1 ketosteroid isomerase [Aeromicrobium sp. Root236]